MLAPHLCAWRGGSEHPPREANDTWDVLRPEQTARSRERTGRWPELDLGALFLFLLLITFLLLSK